MYIDAEVRAYLQKKDVQALLDRRIKNEWLFDGKRSESYEQTFESLIEPDQTFQQMIDNRKTAGGTTHVIDLFGSAKFVEDPAVVDSLTAVRIADSRHVIKPKRGTLIDGNLYSGHTWGEIRRHMRQRHIPSFDFIVSRPLGGIVDSTDDTPRYVSLGIYYLLLKRAYSFLNTDNGLLVTQLPSFQGEDSSFRKAFFTEWIDRLKQQDVDIKGDAHTIRIDKHADSPLHLPEVGLYTYFDLKNFASIQATLTK